MDLAYIDSHHKDYVKWRHHLHRHPELSFQEHSTADFICARLEEFGVSYHRLGSAGLGIVGVVNKSAGENNVANNAANNATNNAANNTPNNATQDAIGLRADIDALPIVENNTFAHHSVNEGVMHACGHDGHTAMLLGAAQYAAAHSEELQRDVYFIFQPAEEMGGGAAKMIEDGLFQKFNMRQVYGLHNWPGLNIGDFAICKGPIMAAVDFFDITISGGGGHAAMPQLLSDTVVTTAQIITQLQSVVSRNTDPTDALVISVTSIKGGDAYNVIPSEVLLKGTIRYFNNEVREQALERIRAVLAANCSCNGLKFEFDSHTTTAATINHEQEVELAVQAAQKISQGRVFRDISPSMGGEDFAYMLAEKPGAYIWMGNGESASLHNPNYDFNDNALVPGVKYWLSVTNII